MSNQEHNQTKAADLLDEALALEIADDERTDNEIAAMRLRWIVEFEVAGNWIQDGFNLTSSRALAMLQEDLRFADAGELGARVLSAPARSLILQLQGYTAEEAERGALMLEDEALAAEIGRIGERRLEIARALDRE